MIRTLLPEDVSEGELIRVLEDISGNCRIHGCLLFRPLPDRLNTSGVMGALCPEKDIDSMTSTSMGGLMVRGAAGFPPCTAAACMELLRYYQVELTGRNVAMIGSGMTVGMPTAILLMNQGATVSVCNIFTDPARMTELCRGADVIISAAGKAGRRKILRQRTAGHSPDDPHHSHQQQRNQLNHRGGYLKFSRQLRRKGIQGIAQNQIQRG